MVAGRRLTYVDLSLFQLVEGLRYAFPKRMKAFERKTPGLVGLHDRVGRGRISTPISQAADVSRSTRMGSFGTTRNWIIEGETIQLSFRDVPPGAGPESWDNSGFALSRAPEWLQRGYRFLPSIGVIVSFARSMPSMVLTLSATTSVPSGFMPRANTSTPQSAQN